MKINESLVTNSAQQQALGWRTIWHNKTALMKIKEKYHNGFLYLHVFSLLLLNEFFDAPAATIPIFVNKCLLTTYGKILFLQDIVVMRMFRNQSMLKAYTFSSSECSYTVCRRNILIRKLLKREARVNSRPFIHR